MDDLLQSLRSDTSTYFITKYQSLQDSPYILQAIQEATLRHYFIKTLHSFPKNTTTKTIQDRHSYLPVKTPQMNLHTRNYLLLPIPLTLTSIVFLSSQATDAYRTLLLVSCLTIVLVRHPTEFVISMAVSITPQPGS